MLNKNFCHWTLLIIIMSMILIYFFSDRIQRFEKTSTFFFLNLNPNLSLKQNPMIDDRSLFQFEFQIELDLNHRFDEFISNDQWKSDRIVGIQYENFNLFLSTIKSAEMICHIYLQMWNDLYQLKSFRIPFINDQSISLPRIFSLKSELNLTDCPTSIESYLINAKRNHLSFLLKIVEIERKTSKFFLFDSSLNRFGDSLFRSIEGSSMGVPLITNENIYLIQSIQPLKIVRCSKQKSFCRTFFESKSTIDDQMNYLRPSTEFRLFDENKSLFIGFVQSQLSVRKCENLLRCHLMILTLKKKTFSFHHLSDILPFEDLPLFHSSIFPPLNNRTDHCFGLIRTIECQSIVRLDRENDQIDLIVLIDKKKNYLMKVNGLTKFIDKITKQPSSTKSLSSVRLKTLKFYQNQFELKKNLWKQIEMEENIQRENIVQDIISSPTNPSFRLASNAPGIHLKSWINYDRVNFGLMGRYLKSIEQNSRSNSNLMIDAGGNHGIYGFYAAKFNQNVFTFEILPKYWIVIRESLRLNEEFQRFVRLYPYGVSDQFGLWNVFPDDGTTKLENLHSNNSMIRIQDFQWISLKKTTSIIPSYSLDDFIFQRISLLKVDVEGFEIRVLKGIEQTMKRFSIGAILIELAPYRWSSNQITIDEGISYLNSITRLGSYSNYLIGTNDFHCPTRNFTIIKDLIRFENLTMINMIDGHIEMAPLIYQIFNWTSIISQMNVSFWSCNVWMEKLDN